MNFKSKISLLIFLFFGSYLIFVLWDIFTDQKLLKRCFNFPKIDEIDFLGFALQEILSAEGNIYYVYKDFIQINQINYYNGKFDRAFLFEGGVKKFEGLSKDPNHKIINVNKGKICKYKL